MDIQPEDMAGVSTHPSEDRGSGAGSITKKEDDSFKYLYTLKDVRKYLIDRLSIDVVPTNAIWQSGYKYSSKDKVEMYAGDLVRVHIVPSRGTPYWNEAVIIHGDGGFYYKNYRIKRKGEVILSHENHLTSQKSKDFKLEVSYLRDIKS